MHVPRNVLITTYYVICIKKYKVFFFHVLGPKHDLNSLTTILNLEDLSPFSGDIENGPNTTAFTAMERAVIKSRLRIPFWKPDEVYSTMYNSFIDDQSHVVRWNHWTEITVRYLSIITYVDEITMLAECYRLKLRSVASIQ